MFDSAITKMALKKFAAFMDEKNINETLIFKDEKGELAIKTIDKPDFFIPSNEVEAEKQKFRDEFQRLRGIISDLQTQLNSKENG